MEHTHSLQEHERFFEISQEMLVISSLDTRKQSYNPATTAVFGYTSRELEAMRPEDFFHPEDLPAAIAAIEKLGRGERVTFFDSRGRHKSGSYRWLRWNAVPYLEEGVFYASARDVTEEYTIAAFHAEQNRILQLLTTGAELGQVLDALVRLVEGYLSSVRAAILLLDSDGANLHLAAHASLPDEIVQVFLSVPNTPDSSSCGAALHRHERVVVEDIAHDPLTSTYADLLLSHNIRSSWSQPIFSSDGTPVGSLACFHDRPIIPSLTETTLAETAAYLIGFAIEMRNAEAALRRSEQRYRQVVTQTLEAIFLVDAKTTHILEANPALCRLLGYTQEEIKDLTLYDIVAHDRASIEENVQQVLRNNGWNVGERLYLRKDGTAISVEANATPFTENGRDVLCVVARDVTARKETERQIQLLFTGARCLLWHAEIREVPGAQNLQERFLWKLCVPNEDAAQQFFPLEISDGLNYTKAWEKSVAPNYIDKMYERSSKAFLNDENQYSHEFQCRNRDGVLFWFREDVRVEKVEPHFWRAVGICTDVTQSKEMELQRDVSQEKYRLLFENIPTGIYRTTPDGRILLANPALIRMLGYDSFVELAERKLGVDEGIGANSRKEFIAMIEEKGEIQGWEVNWQRKDGTFIAIRENAKVIRHPETGATLYYEGSIEDITERKKAEETIRWQAEHDALTALPNRTRFYQFLENALIAAHETQGQVAVLFIDLDRFKQINDTLGHAQGDRLLQEVARRLNRSLRTEEVIARISGDEFVILLPNIINSQTATMTARKLRGILSRPLLLSGHEVVVTASVGISIYPQDGQDAETILGNADVAMYRAKAQGGDSSQLYTQTMNSSALRRLTMETSLRKGLTRREFTLVYQPQVDMRTRRIVGVEALIRWNHPEQGTLEPHEFIQVAEETGLIAPLGEWVLQEVCLQATLWRLEGNPIRVSANLSARQFALHNLAEKVAFELKQNKLPGHWLDLELTETAILEHGDDALMVLNELKKLGVRMVVDDFGTGYSSLRYLRKFPLDVLKVDQSFVAGMTYRNEDRAIVRAVIELAHALGMEVIAEGVETEAQRESLRIMGCEMYQGFLFSKPRTASDISAILRSSMESSSRLVAV